VALEAVGSRPTTRPYFFRINVLPLLNVEEDMDLSARFDNSVDGLFEAYLKEVRYLRNFSEKTITCCKEIFKRWNRLAGGCRQKKICRFW
jgi:hypothetical protein